MRIDGDLQEEIYKTKKQDIESEIRRLEKERQNVNYNTDNWITRVEKRLDYALYAEDKLENGDFIEKTGILSDLGANLTIKGEKLCYDLDIVLKILKDSCEFTSYSLERFELNEIVIPTANVGAYNELISNWQGSRDSVTNYLH